MKQITISAIIKPNDDAITLDEIKRMLGHLGTVYYTSSSEVEMADLGAIQQPMPAWIYISADDSVPYRKVSGHGETEGEDISNEEADFMAEHGIVDEFHAQYPRADRYGAPLYATDEDFAAGLVGYHGFRVASNGLVVSTEDGGDDTPEQIWFRVCMPAAKQFAPSTNVVLEAQEEIADKAVSDFDFGDGVTVVGSDGWSRDLNGGEDDWVKVVYVTCDDDKPAEDSKRVSFHVKFHRNDTLMTESYAYWLDTGAEMGCPVEVHRHEA